MRGFLKKILLTVSLLSIITMQVGANILPPPNVELLGDASGLVHIPSDDLFLYYPNMIPGDSIKQTLEVKNKYDYPYKLFMKAKRVSPKEEYDLLEKLELKITYKGETIYEGPTSGKNKLVEDISLGIFEPGQEEELVAEVKLDGPSTGNEYKNKYAEVDWIFTAVRSEEPAKDTTPGKKPSPSKNNSIATGDNGEVLLYSVLAGASLILLLVAIKNKTKVKE